MNYPSSMLALVVNPDHDASRVIAEILKKADFEVHCVDTSEEAWNAIWDYDYSLVILEQQLPGFQGDAFARALSRYLGFGKRVTIRVPQRMPFMLLCSQNTDSINMKSTLCCEQVLGVVQKPLPIEFLQRLANDCAKWVQYHRPQRKLA